MGQPLAALSINQASPLAIASLISGTADPPPGVVNLDAVVGEHRVNLVRNGGDRAQQEVPGGRCRRRLMQFDKGELRHSINGDEHCRLQGIEAVIERQQGIAPEGDDDCPVFHRQHRRTRCLGTDLLVGYRGPRFPLGNRLRVDPVAFGQNPQALLTMLYRSTDRLCRRRAPMEYLAHSASIRSRK